MKINFITLKYFKKVAELENLTKAAEALHIAEPALSRTIRGMEKELGVTLFKRKGRNIRLTNDGLILLKRSNRLLKEYKEMEKELKNSKDKQQMTVKLAVLSDVKFIPSFLCEFKKVHPDAIIEIVNPNAANSLDPYDLSLFSSMDQIKNDHTIPLFRENMVMLLPKTNRSALFPCINLADCADFSYIAPPRGMELRDLLEIFCQKAGFTPKVVMESENSETIHEFVKADLGAAMVPQITWRSASHNLFAVPIGDIDCCRYLNLSWKNGSKLSLMASQLKEFLIKGFWKYVQRNAILPES